MKLTIRHRYSFGSGGVHELNTAAAWDEIRSRGDVFGLPETREGWLSEAASRDEFERRAEAVVCVARGLEARSVCSYGVGTAYLEQRLTVVAPDLELICTDFAPRAVARLGAHFPEARVVLHDLQAEAPLNADLHLLHRLDTEFSDEAWPPIFARFDRPVVVLASEFLRPRVVARELATRCRHPRATKAGWLRTEGALRGLWSASHDDQRIDADLPAYLLLPRREGVLVPSPDICSLPLADGRQKGRSRRAAQMTHRSLCWFA